MASRVDSLQDIFGPSEPSGAEAVETAPAVASSSATTNLDEFDDIFASSTDIAPAPAAPSGDEIAHKLKTTDITPVPASSGSTDVSPSTDDFDDIFGNAPLAATEGLLPSSKEQTGGKSNPAEGTTSEGASSEEAQQARSDTKAMGTAELGRSPAPVAGGSTGGDDREFLNFLYDDDKKGKATATAVTPQAEEEAAASLLVVPEGTTTSTTATTAAAAADDTFPALGSTPADSSSAPEENSPSLPAGGPPGASGASSPSSHLDSVPLGSPLLDGTKNASSGSTSAAVTAAAERLEEAVKEGELDTPSPSPAMPPPPSWEMCFVRKEKVEVLLPLPEDPATALRQLALPETATSAAAAAEAGAEEGAGEEEGAVSMASRAGGSDGRGPAAAVSDVGYVRRLCAATGGFLPLDIRAVVWGLLLGLGRRPEDKGFVKWREARRRDGAATVAYMLDLRNDCLALARRLCDDGGGGGGGGGSGGEGGGGAGVKGDPEALAVDIEEVCTVWGKRRS